LSAIFELAAIVVSVIEGSGRWLLTFCGSHVKK